jgi:hypothetical protein
VGRPGLPLDLEVDFLKFRHGLAGLLHEDRRFGHESIGRRLESPGESRPHRSGQPELARDEVVEVIAHPPTISK